VENDGELIASGRDADIFAYGNDKVLRRSRNGRSMLTEARTMQYVRAHGYPVPEVFSVSDDGSELVMQRIDGPTMVDAAGSKPWKIRGFGRELAALHTSLHAIPTPDWLPVGLLGSGDKLLHMDLHPLNVLLSKDGPVVIDWTNAVRGDPTIDVAVTWLLIHAGEPPTSGPKAVMVEMGRKALLRAFLQSFSLDEIRTVLGDVVAWKCRDTNMSAVEVRRMQSLLSAPPD
jgi:aminoglycoside phosphotransferase (APT) family kinase protein